MLDRARGYRFEFVHRDGSIDCYDLGRVEDDAAARRRAREALLVSLSAQTVAVWRDAMLIDRIRRDGAATSVAS
jgi:hypothetical protein